MRGCPLQLNFRRLLETLPTLVFKRPKSRTSLNSWPPNQILERLNSIKITLLLVMPILLLSWGPPNTPKCCRTPALAVKLTRFCALARGKDSEITTWFHDEEIMTVKWWMVRALCSVCKSWWESHGTRYKTTCSQILLCHLHCSLILWEFLDRSQTLIWTTHKYYYISLWKMQFYCYIWK